MKPFTLLASALLGLIALAHLLRLIAGTEVRVGGFPVPLWMSAVAAFALGTIALLVLWERRQP